jgi:transposase-like protein
VAMIKRVCTGCKKKRLVLVKKFFGMRLTGWECESCGKRMAYGDHLLGKGLWNVAHKWIGEQKIKEGGS